jgi:large subunit ribosomal protein L24
MSGRAKLMKTLYKSRKKLKPQLVEAAKKDKFNIVRGDKVQVIGNHPEKGKQGIVEKVLRDRDRVIVQGINLGTMRIKGNPDRGIMGGTQQVPRAIHYSNVNLVDPVTGKPTRVAKKILDDGQKVRVAKKSGAIIPRPEILKVRKRAVSSIVTESDTLDEDVWELTYSMRNATMNEDA